MNYYPHHIGDYLRDTSHLSLVEHGAYRRMLDVYYATEKPLPKQQEKIYRIVGAKTNTEKCAVNAVLDEFWIETKEGWRNARADAEIAKAHEKAEKARTSAAFRWQSEGKANAMRTHSERNTKAMLPITNNQKPITKSQKPKATLSSSESFALPPWVPSDAWQDWLKTRKARSNTRAALALAVKRLEEFKAGGMDPKAVLEQSIANGWQGLFPLRGNSGAGSKQAGLEARNKAAGEEWLKEGEKEVGDDPSRQAKVH